MQLSAKFSFLFAVILTLNVDAADFVPMVAISTSPSAKCQTDFGNFEKWRDDLKADALRAGITTATWNAALPYLTFDEKIVERDRGQSGFYKSFLDFAIPRAHPRINPARQVLKKYADVFARLENDFGISAAVIVAFWGMETDFATTPRQGLTPVLRSVTTLAFDCRRAFMFRENVLDGLRLIQNGDIKPENFNGEWAGEMSGLQFTPSNYFNFGVDFDGDGRRDPVHSVADMLGTAANMFKSYGWRKGEPFLVEVRVPDDMPWEEADMSLGRMHSVSYWAKFNVTAADGTTLATQNLDAALMLPMGRLGPSFLAFENFKALQRWNASTNNALTAGYLALRIENPNLRPLSPGKKSVEVLSQDDLKLLQTKLAARGYDVGKIDGYLGNQTREAIRDMQLKLKLPADSYPTRSLLGQF